MAALKINRNIVAVEYDALKFLHSKLRAVSEPSEPSGTPSEDKNDEET